MTDAETKKQGATSLVLTLAVTDAFSSSDWVRLRALYHDDALSSTIAAQQEILSPDALISVLERLTSSDSMYVVDRTTMSAIDETSAIVTGQIRYPLPGGGFGEGSRAWVLTYVDDLLYRSCAYTTVAKALAAYAEHGPTLGIESAPPSALV